MKKFSYLILLILSMIILAACIPSGGFDPDKPLVATPGPTQSQSPGITPSQGNLVRGSIFLDEIQLFVMESFPVQIALHVKGELPTPCHSFSFTITEPNEKNEIHVDVYSSIEEGSICIQIIQPFDETISIPMIGKPDGEYTVWVNGELIDKFSYPG
jgi:inhibitor of cysteine peptidase